MTKGLNYEVTFLYPVWALVRQWKHHWLEIWRVAMYRYLSWSGSVRLWQCAWKTFGGKL